MMDLVIVGAGGHGREVLQLVRDINAVKPTWNLSGFVDDAWTAPRELAGVPVLGKPDWLQGRSCAVTVAIGSPAVRRKVVQRLMAAGVRDFATLVHPEARIGARVTIGAGSMIAVAAVVTTDVRLGQHVLVNTAAVISHDCEVADWGTLAPRATLCGAARLAEGAEVCAGATVLQGIEVGPWSRVGGGACVINPVGANETVVGVPASCVRVRDMNWQDA
ncbi:acetyltransferase [Viridibacterium curvum]|uniref:Acetyltransferase n=1 Tax=Viridibacterium curvum TaxID=1101404 RepID=A0ABP9QLJ5_9RHOO